MAVKVSRGNFGRSKSTGNVIRKKITISRGSSGRRSSSRGSSGGSSGISSRERRTRELQSQGLDRADASQISLAESKGQKITNLRSDVASKIKSKNIKSKSITSKEVQRALPKKEKTQQGTIQGKVYTGVTQREILSNKLNPNTQAKLLASATARRNNIVQAQNRIRQGRGTSRDVLMVASGGTGRADLSEQDTARRTVQSFNLENIGQRERAKATSKGRERLKKSDLSKAQIKIAKNLKIPLNQNTQKIQDQITQVQNLQNKLAKRQTASQDAFRIIPGLRGNNFVQKAFRYGLSIPSLLVIDTPIQTYVTGKKLGILTQQLKNENTRQAGFRELSRTANKFPNEIAKLINPTKPEGLVNLLLLTAPFLKKGGSKAVDSFKKKDITVPKGKQPVSIFSDKKGNYAVVTKSGRTIKVPKEYNRFFKQADKGGKPIRQSKTEIARLEKKSLKEPLTKAENTKLRNARTTRSKKQLDKKVNTEVRKALVGQKPTTLQRAKFKKAYAEYRVNPTNANARKLQKVALDIDVQTGVTLIDRKIKASRKKKPVKKKVSRKRLTEKQRLKRFRDDLKSKSKLAKEKVTKARSKADIGAQKKGFKDFKEQFLYEQNLKKYLKGDLSVGKKLLKIEKSMTKRKSKISKANAKKLKKERNAILDIAVKKLEKGILSVKPRTRKGVAQVKKSKKILKEIQTISDKRIKSVSDFTKLDDLQKALQKNKKVKEIATKKDSPQITVTKKKTAKLSKKQKQKVKQKTKTAVAKAKKRLLGIRSAQESGNKVAQKTNTAIKLITDDIQDIKKINDSIPKSDTVTKSDTKSKVKTLNKVIQQIKQVPKIKKVTKTRKPVKEKLPVKPVKPIKFKPSWDKKPPKGYEYIVNALVRSKGRTKELKLRTTKNRALKKIIPSVDNSLTRSFRLKIVGLKKTKDIKTPPSFRKFRAKKSRGTKVLPVVEKTKYALDTRKEKQDIQRARRLSK